MYNRLGGGKMAMYELSNGANYGKSIIRRTEYVQQKRSIDFLKKAMESRKDKLPDLWQ